MTESIRTHDNNVTKLGGKLEQLGVNHSVIFGVKNFVGIKNLRKWEVITK